MLYPRGNNTIYIAARSQTRIDAAIENIKTTVKVPPGITPAQLKSIAVDFNDLTTVSNAASTFLAQESRLDVLWNNAGVAQQPLKSTTAQGYEIHMGINCLGPYLFTKLLTPILLQSVHVATPNSVRVIFTSSQIVDSMGPAGGVSLAEQEPGKWPDDKNHVYSASKVGNWFMASELDKRVRKNGVVSITQNPGNLRTKAWDPAPWIMKFMMSPFMYEANYGAYTELWCGLSPDITTDDGGKFAIPWGGRWHPSPRADIMPSFKTKEGGGTGLAAEFWEWCDAQTSKYAS
nr:putative oxidoreductase [Quercus suber]